MTRMIIIHYMNERRPWQRVGDTLVVSRFRTASRRTYRCSTDQLNGEAISSCSMTPLNH